MADFLASIDPNQLALLSTAFAIAIADGLGGDEAVALGSFIAAVGDTIELIGSQQLFIESRLNAAGIPQGG